MTDSIDTLPAFGAPLVSGRLKAQPEHFVVRELLGFSADGEGEHMLLTVRKRGANSQWVAKQLARHGRVDVREVGFCGLKDRHAVTEQAYTVPSRSLAPEAWLGFGGEGFEVIAAARHRRKLKRGVHKANEFEITLTELSGDLATLPSRLEAIKQNGVPNYFGQQRFGHEAQNLLAARDWFEQGKAIHDRLQRGFALSAARAFIFNTVLQQRVQLGDWNRLLDGDVANLNGSNSVFAVENVDEVLTQRCTDFDIHPTGPLWGSGELMTRAVPLSLEKQVGDDLVVFAMGLTAAGLCHERRPLRVAVNNFTWTLDSSQLILRFTLAKGSFATALIAELLGSAGNDVEEIGDA